MTMSALTVAAIQFKPTCDLANCFGRVYLLRNNVNGKSYGKTFKEVRDGVRRRVLSCV